MSDVGHPSNGGGQFGFDKEQFNYEGQFGAEKRFGPEEDARGPGPGQEGKFCSSCGKRIRKEAEICPYCGVRVMAPPPAPPFQGRNRIVAALFALFLGGFGIHKFYLGQKGWGILYLIFCWTFIPSIAAFIEFIILLCMSDAKFNARFNPQSYMET